MNFHEIEREGCRLVYEITGEGPPVVFIQGVGVHGRGWSPQVDELSARYRCLTFDNRGMGESRPVGGGSRVPLTVEQMAADVMALLDREGWASAHVVGHSLGGVIAQHLALTAPARVRSLSLLCTVARGADATRLSGRMLWLGLRSQVGTRRMRRRAFLQIVMPPAALVRGEENDLAMRLAPLFGHDLADQPPVAMKQLRALRAYDATPRLAELAGIPTLVLSAGHDPIAPPSRGRALAAGIPGARYHEVAGASHGVPIQCPYQINSLLRDHFTAADRARDKNLQG